MKKEFFKNIILMSRPPFHIVGILPFLIGSLLAYRVQGMFRWPAFMLAVLGVIAIMLSTYYNGEYFDIKEDRLSAKMGKNPFSGGSQVIAQQKIPPKIALAASYMSLFIAAVIGSVLQFVLNTGPWTIPLGIVGIFFGFFYSSPPFRWVSKGVGEIMIGLSYGWLPIAAAYYIQVQDILPLASWISIPIGLSIFNVILINEFADYEADRLSKKRNLVVRVGRQRSQRLYLLAGVMAWSFLAVSVIMGAPILSLYMSIPFFIANIFSITQVLRKKYHSPRMQAVLSGLTILTNIGISLSYLLGIAIGGVG